MQKPYNFTTLNMLKAYLSAQASSLSGFVISKSHISRGHKPRARQINAEVCGSESAIFRTLRSAFNLNNDISQTVWVVTIILHETDS